MSGGTAENGKGAKGAKGARAVSAAAEPSKQTEWTASDDRGPLRAPTETDRVADDAESVVPRGEAEGPRDAAALSAEPEPAEGFPASGTPIPEAAAGEAGETLVVPQPASSDPAAGAATASAPARRSPWPIAAGVVIGSLFGAGSAAIVYNVRSGGASAQASERLDDLATRVGALEKRPDPQPAIADVRNEVHALAGRVASLEKRPAPVGAQSSAPPSASPSASPQSPAGGQAKPAASTQAGGGGDVAGEVAGLQAALDAMGKRDGSQQAAIKDLSGKLEAIQTSLTQVQAASRSNADAVKGQQQEVDGKLAALQNAVSGAQKQASAAQSDLSAVQGSLATVQGEQKALTAKVGAPALAVAADSLVAQVEAGRPYRAQLDAAAALGADPARLAALRENAGSGVPSAQALLQSFAPLADPVIATGSRAPASANFGEQLKHGLFGLVNVHRADDTGGNDLASRVALLQSDLAHGDVGGAYAVWSALPADAKAKSQGFGVKLKSSADALAAARGLQAQSIETLTAGAPAARKS